jgi:putative glutamine amidotransferase
MPSVPLIGISTSEMRVPARVRPMPQGEPAHRELALGMPYTRAVERAGGLPVVLPPIDEAGVEALLDRLSGLCLPGGPDLHPRWYGDTPHPELGPTEPELDAFELALARRADALGMPILAICRGAQLLNVARGGTLHQHLPGRSVPLVVPHRQMEAPERASHAVDVEGGSLLALWAGAAHLEVNSFHHQAVRRLGADLRAVAWAPDGVVEAIEAPDRPFVLGVQWHAEGLAARPEQAALFRAFVEAAAAYESARELDTVEALDGAGALGRADGGRPSPAARAA